MKARAGYHYALPLSPKRAWRASPTKKYTFKVACDANKIEIAKAVETLFLASRLPR